MAARIQRGFLSKEEVMTNQSMIKDYVTNEPASGEDQYEIVCPFCNCDNTHLLEANEEHEVSNDSRLGAELKFECEAGCLFNLNIYQWKGRTNVRATNFGKRKES